MNCQEVQPLIQDYIDGELESGQAAEVGRHIEACGTCRSEAEALKKVITAVSALPRVSAPAGFAEKVIARSDEADAPPSSDRVVPMRPSPLLSRVVGIAATVIVAVIIIFIVARAPWRPTRVAHEQAPATHDKTGKTAYGLDEDKTGLTLKKSGDHPGMEVKKSQGGQQTMQKGYVNTKDMDEKSAELLDVLKNKEEIERSQAQTFGNADPGARKRLADAVEQKNKKARSSAKWADGKPNDAYARENSPTASPGRAGRVPRPVEPEKPAAPPVEGEAPDAGQGQYEDAPERSLDRSGEENTRPAPVGEGRYAAKGKKPPATRAEEADEKKKEAPEEKRKDFAEAEEEDAEESGAERGGEPEKEFAKTESLAKKQVEREKAREPEPESMDKAEPLDDEERELKEEQHPDAMREKEVKLVFHGDEAARARDLLEKLQDEIPNLVMVTEKEKERARKLAKRQKESTEQKRDKAGESMRRPKTSGGGAQADGDQSAAEEPRILVIEVDEKSYEKVLAELRKASLSPEADERKAPTIDPGKSEEKEGTKKSPAGAEKKKDEADLDGVEIELVIIVRLKGSAAGPQENEPSKAAEKKNSK
ncbi:MAG: anti-sigma factor family protein [Planctomycetota bacterium]|jgi:hypothetical protein